MLTRIQALNYRCLRYVDRPLLPFQVLIGPNASGKSAFLDVVALLGDYVREGIDKALLQTFQNPTGRATHIDELIFNQSAPGFELAIELQVPEKLASRYQYARYEVGFTKRESGEVAIAHETLWLHNDPPPIPAQPPDFPIEPVPPDTILNKSPLPGWRLVVNKITETDKDYFHDEFSDWEITFRVGSRKSALAGLPQDEERFPIAIWVRDLLRDRIYTIALNSHAMRRPCSASEPHTFKVDGSNLPVIIRDLQQKTPEVFRDWVGHIRTILPGFQKILILERPEDKHLYLAIQYEPGGDPVPSWLISDGSLRILALTAIAYTPYNQGIFLIEEPETSIDPNIFEDVYLSLSSVYEGQILLATHFSRFLNIVKRNESLCFAKNPSGTTDIVSLDKHPMLDNWHGLVSLATYHGSGMLK